MATLRVRAQTDGMQRVQDDFDGLTRAQQKMILQGSQVGKQFDKMAQKLEGTGKSTRGLKGGIFDLKGMLSSATQAALTFTGSFAGMRGVQLLLEASRRELERFKTIADAATKAGGSTSQSVGALFLNAGDLAANPEEGQRIVANLRNMSVRSGRDLDEVVGAFTSLRPQTPGSTDDERLQALGLGFKAKQLNQDFDAPGFAASLLGVVQESKSRGQQIGVDEASDKFFALADQFGGNTNEFGAPLARLTGLTSTGASLDQLGGALAFGVATTKKKPEAVIEGLAPLLTKLAAEDQIKIGQRNVRLSGDDPFAKLDDFMNRLDAGEFGTNRAAAVQDLIRGGGGINTQLLLGQIMAQREQYNTALNAGVNASPGSLDSRFEAARAADSEFDERQRVREAEARSFLVNAGDSSSQGVELQAKQVEELARQLGLDPSQERYFKQFASGPLTALAVGNEETLGDEIRTKIRSGRSGDSLQRQLLEQVLIDQPVDHRLHRFEGGLSDIRAAGQAGGVEAFAREAVLTGNVNLADGVNRQEQAILQLAGIQQRLLEQLLQNNDERARGEGMERQAELLEEIHAELVEMREAGGVTRVNSTEPDGG